MGEAAGDRLDPDLSDRLSQDAASIRRWIYAVAVVQFDVDVGPVVECIYPEGILCDHLRYIIQMTAIPDCAKAELGDRFFVIRVPGEDLIGIVCFRQIPDPALSRGFFQKSFVILTKLPLVDLWQSIASVLAPIYFEHGIVSVIEAAAHSLSEWPDPLSIRGWAQLPFLGQVIAVNIEDGVQVQGDALYGLYHHVGVYDTFATCLDILWTLWQLAMEGAPLLIIAADPTTTTDVVLGLVSLISPSFVYYADYRPYFTISDPDYRAYLTMCRHRRLPGCILGATSKYFLESFGDFPNVLVLDHASGPMLTTEFKPRVRCDRNWLKTLDDCDDKNAALRQYFSTLTATFMCLFDPMFKPIPYVPRDVHPRVFNPFLDQPKLPEFTRDGFVTNLPAAKPCLAPLKRYIASTKKISAFLIAVIQGPNFLPWFDFKRTEASRDIDSRMDAAIIAADMDEIVDGLSLSDAESMRKEIKRRQACPRTRSRPALIGALGQHYEIVKDVITRLNYSLA